MRNKIFIIDSNGEGLFTEKSFLELQKFLDGAINFKISSVTFVKPNNYAQRDVTCHQQLIIIVENISS